MAHGEIRADSVSNDAAVGWIAVAALTALTATAAWITLSEAFQQRVPSLTLMAVAGTVAAAGLLGEIGLATRQSWGALFTTAIVLAGLAVSPVVLVAAFTSGEPFVEYSLINPVDTAGSILPWIQGALLLTIAFIAANPSRSMLVAACFGLGGWTYVFGALGLIEAGDSWRPIMDSVASPGLLRWLTIPLLFGVGATLLWASVNAYQAHTHQADVPNSADLACAALIVLTAGVVGLVGPRELAAAAWLGITILVMVVVSNGPGQVPSRPNTSQSLNTALALVMNAVSVVALLAFLVLALVA